MKYIGAHLPFKKNKQLLGIVENCILINSNIAALFIGTPQRFEVEKLSPTLTKQAYELAKKHNILIENFVIHAKYVINFASTNFENWNRSLQIGIKECQAADELGIKYYTIHPGSNKEVEEGIKQCAKAINNMIKNSKKVIVLIETMPTKGNFLGKNFNEIEKIISLVDIKKRVGVCFDSTHLWDDGMDIKNNFENILQEFDYKIGINYLKAFHISDSLSDLGSKKDRHAVLGAGKIGVEAIKNIVNNSKLNNLSFILETPNDVDGFKKEIEILKKES